MNDASKPSTVSAMTEAPQQPRQFIAGLIQLGLIAGVLLFALAVNFFLSQGSSEPRKRAIGPSELVVEVVRPESVTTLIEITETGTVELRSSVRLTPQVGGRVLSVSPNLATGGAFKAGEVLFRIDPDDARAAADQTQSNVLSAESNLELALAEAEIAQREWGLVHPNDPIPPLVAREPQITQARAALSAAEAALRAARLNLSRVNYSLPFDGRVLSTSLEVGQTLSPGQSYGEVYSLDSLEVSIPLKSTSLVAIMPATGRSAVVRIPEGRVTIELAATVVRVDAQLDKATRLTRLMLTFDDVQSIPPGAFVEVTISGPEIKDGYSVPSRAFSRDNTLWIIQDGHLEARTPVILTSDRERVITAPFDAGDGVIITPLNNPVEGTAARIAGSGGQRP